jgi:hypothetical protein
MRSARRPVQGSGRAGGGGGGGGGEEAKERKEVGPEEKSGAFCWLRAANVRKERKS